MRVLVAGASGAIGRHLLPQLIAEGHEVFGITRRAGSVAGDGVTEIVADVLDRARFLASIDGVRAEAVIHLLAAPQRPARTRRAMGPINRRRTEGTSALLAAARRVGAHTFVAASAFSGYGFRDHGMTPLPETARFGDPDSRNDAVQAALLSNELQVRAFGGVLLRFGLVYDPAVSRHTPVAERWAGELPLVHVADAASATVAALARGRSREAYNIADDLPATYRELQTRIALASGSKPPVAVPDVLLQAAAPFGAELLTRTAMYLSTAKARDELGWSPRYPGYLDGIPLRDRLLVAEASGSTTSARAASESTASVAEASGS